MVQVDENGVRVEWLKGAYKGRKQKISKADADKLLSIGWVKSLDEPPKDKAVKSPPKKK